MLQRGAERLEPSHVGLRATVTAATSRSPLPLWQADSGVAHGGDLPQDERRGRDIGRWKKGVRGRVKEPAATRVAVAGGVCLCCGHHEGWAAQSQEVYRRDGVTGQGLRSAGVSKSFEQHTGQRSDQDAIVDAHHGWRPLQ